MFPCVNRIWTFPFILLILISLISTGTVDALQAALPILIAQMGGSSTLGGLMVTIFAAAAILPYLLVGYFADTWGCRKIMLWGGVLFLLGMSAPLFIAGKIPLFIFRTIQGVGFAILNVTAAAGASNILPPARLGEGLGYFGVGQSLAMAVGPMSGLWLVAHPIVPIWLAAAVGALFILLFIAFCRCDQKDRPQTELAPFSFRNVIEFRAFLPAIMILIFSTGACAIIVFAGFYAKERGYGNAGPFFMIAAAAMILIRFASGIFMDKFKTLTILLPTMAVGALTFLLPAFFLNRAAFYIAGGCFGLSFGVLVPLLAAYTVKKTPPERWGAANATYYLGLNLGFCTGSFLGGLSIDAFGFEHAALLGTLTALLPAVLGILFLRENQK